MTDVANLFLPPPPAGWQPLYYRQGTIAAFDQVTGDNTVDVGGSEFADLPLLGVAEADTYAAGSVVGLISTGLEYAIFGRLVRPNTPEYTDAVNKLGNNIQTATIATAENTTSTSLVDLTTPGPSLTVTVRSSGKLIIILSADETAQDTGVSSGAYMTCEITDTAGNVIYLAGTLPSLRFEYSDNAAHAVGDSLGSTRVFAVSLNPGSYIVNAKYSSASGANSAGFANRNLTTISI